MEFYDMLFFLTPFISLLPMLAIVVLGFVVLIKKVREANPDTETLLKEYPFLQVSDTELRIGRVQLGAFLVMAIGLITTISLAVVLDFSDFHQIPFPLLVSFGIMIAGAAVFVVTTIITNIMHHIRYIKYGYYDF